MNLDREIDRRHFLKEAAAATGVFFGGLPQIGRAQDTKGEDEIAQAQTELPVFISPEELPTSPTIDSIATYQKNFETRDFTSNNFEYTADLPTDWVYQPGLSLPEAPVDIFLGQTPIDFQTTVWIYKTPAPEGATPADYLNQVMTEMTFHHYQQLESTGSNITVSPPIGEIFANIKNPEDFVINYPAGEKNGWVVNSYMPKESKSFYYLTSSGFIKDNHAWHFNASIDGEELDILVNEIQKYMTMLSSVELK